MLEGGHGPYAADEMALYRERNGDVRGVVYYGSQLVIAADVPAAVDAFAIETRKYPALRSFVGPAPEIHALWKRVRSWYRAPSLVREHQPLYLLTPAALRLADRVEVRRARIDEAELVAHHSAEMMTVELGYDPRSARAAFSSGVKRGIELGWWWVWIVDGELRFQCNIGARTASTAQIQGVWVPPAARRRGYARHALGAICAALLAENATLSLYVNDFNTDAIALYEWLGFQRRGELATYLFP